MQKLIDQALLALGRLESITTLLPDPSFFLYMYVRKEAVLSSQIEGTQSSLSDLLLYESDAALGVPLADTEEVSNYVAAMTHALQRMLRDNFPLSARLLCEIHELLLAGGRGSEKGPGEFRSNQNWVGADRAENAVFIPPPWQSRPPITWSPCFPKMQKKSKGLESRRAQPSGSMPPCRKIP